MEAEASAEFSADPVLYAQIQFVLLLVGSMVPPDQLKHESQRTFAVSEPSEFMPLPSRSVTCAALLYFGMTLLAGLRGERVTLFLPLA